MTDLERKLDDLVKRYATGSDRHVLRAFGKHAARLALDAAAQIACSFDHHDPNDCCVDRAVGVAERIRALLGPEGE